MNDSLYEQLCKSSYNVILPPYDSQFYIITLNNLSPYQEGLFATFPSICACKSHTTHIQQGVLLQR